MSFTHNNTIIIKPIIYGSIAFSLGKKNPEKEKVSHKWCAYVRGVDNEDISNFIKEVHFKLHDSFKNPERVINTWPFELYEVGWGEFDIRIKIYLVDETLKPIDLIHSLKLYPNTPHSLHSTKKPVVSENYDEIIFVNPKPNIKELLLKNENKIKKEEIKEEKEEEESNEINNNIKVIDNNNVIISKGDLENMNLDEDNNINNIQENNINNEDNLKMDIEIENDDEKSNNINSNNNNIENNISNSNFNSINLQSKEENENNKISANISNISQYFTKIDDSAHLLLLENSCFDINKRINEIKSAITEKEKQISDIIKQIKNFA